MVEPKVFLVGYTYIHLDGLRDYLEATGNLEFLASVEAALAQGLSHGEILCSTFAKLCYAALKVGDNLNITRVRDIPDNIKACFASAHGSVFEHAQLNFIATDVSRVFTHELVRHRAGTAFSQTSGRYVRRDKLVVVEDPILQEYNILAPEEAEELRTYIEGWMLKMGQRIEDCRGDFTLKKQLTSAVRRWLPNGQANEIAFSCNLRAIRHIVMMRTAAGAEREIRQVFAQVYTLLKGRFPLLFFGAQERIVKGILEVYGMRTQPYEALAP